MATLEALGKKRDQDGLWDLPMKQGNEDFGGRSNYVGS